MGYTFKQKRSIVESQEIVFLSVNSVLKENGSGIKSDLENTALMEYLVSPINHFRVMQQRCSTICPLKMIFLGEAVIKKTS